MHTLTHVLDIQPGEMVAFVGAGGKTTTLQRLLVELRAAGRTVLTTSTVHMFPLKGVPAHPFVIESDPEALAAQIPALLAEAGHVRVAGEQLRMDKIRGLDAAQVAALKGLPGLDNLLVEADGARHRSLKAPAAHEPALPAGVDLLLIIVGLDIIGKPLDDDHVHRPEQVAAITGLSPGATITPAAAAAVVTSAAGGLKDVPPGVRCWVVATKFNQDRALLGGELASAVLAARDPRIEGVVLLGAGPVEQIGSAPMVVVKW